MTKYELEDEINARLNAVADGGMLTEFALNEIMSLIDENKGA